MTSYSRSHDEALLRVLKLITSPSDRKSFSLVCRHWLKLYGQVTTSLRLYDWSMLESGRLARRFPNLTHLDLTGAWSNSPDPEAFGPFAVYMSRGGCAMRIDPEAADPFNPKHRIDEQTPEVHSFDNGLRVLVSSYPNLRSLHIVDVFRPRERSFRKQRLPAFYSSDHLLELGDLPLHALVRPSGAFSERSVTNSTTSSTSSGMSSPIGLPSLDESVERVPQGLEIVADGLPMLQEITIRQCMDTSLDALSRATSGCPHLQTVRLVGALEGFYHAAFSDRGLKKLPRSCPRILELHLNHGDVGLEGLASIAQGCDMLSELHLSGRSYALDWLQALCLFVNLQALHLKDFSQLHAQRCGIIAHGSCPSVKELSFEHCDLRSAEFFGAILRVCSGVSHLTIRGCRGLTNHTFGLIPTYCRKLAKLDVEGCPLLTSAGLEPVVLGLDHLQNLRVSRCQNILEHEMSERLADVIFSPHFKVLKWEPAASVLVKKTQKDGPPARTQSGPDQLDLLCRPRV